MTGPVTSEARPLAKEQFTLGMTLSDALVAMAPSDATLAPEESASRDAATTLVYHALVRLAPRVAHPDVRDLVAQDILIRLSTSRPGRRRYTATDGEAEAYLIKALGNRVIDLHRKTQRERARWVSAEPDEDGWAKHEAVDETTPEGVAIAHETADRVERATAVLFDQAIPAIAATLQNPEGFLMNVADLRAIADGELTVDQIVEREGGHGDAYVKVRNRVYQRHKRTRAYLLEVPRNKPDELPRLTQWLRDAALPAALEDEVRRIATEIFAPRVDRGDGRPGAQEQDS